MRKILSLALILFPFIVGAAHNSDSIPYPFYNEDPTGESQMMPLHHGEEAFQLRLEMIRRAQSTIEVEYYIYNMDMIGKIFTRELVKAARRGVKIRMLVDKLATGLNVYLAHELAKHGIEIKFYNTNLLIELASINFRNHRKLLIIDGQEAITGGRNLGDEYFNIAKKYNYEDRDVYVKGPIVVTMRDSFNSYFKHKIAHVIKRSDRPVAINAGRSSSGGKTQQKQWDDGVKTAKEFLAETSEERVIRFHFEKVGNLQLARNNVYPCPVATFVTDSPGGKGSAGFGKSYNDIYRNVRKTFLDKILPIDKSLTISTPYFIANKRNKFIFEELLKKGVELNLYSNSLRSTDSVLVSASLYLHLSEWLKKGMKVFFHDGQNTKVGDAPIATTYNAQWGTHAKTHIYESKDSSEVMIGTYNLDNRSDYYNTELALFCKGNDDFTQNVKADVLARMAKGLKAESRTHALDRNGQKINITGASPIKQLKMKLLTIPAWLFLNLL